MATTRDKIAERRLAKMRMGQAVCEFAILPSDKETRFALVPLTEAEYMQALEAVSVMVIPDNLVGAELMDRRRAQETLIRSIREESDLTQRVFDDVDDLMEVCDVADIDFLIDEYNRMTANSSPSVDGISPEEFRNLKELLQTMDWNALSGRAWYEARRFLLTITPSPLLDNSPGLSSTSQLTTKSD